MTFEVRFSLEAKDDLEKLKAYIARDNPAVATDVIMCVRKLANVLAAFPHLGKRSEVPDAYKIPVAGSPYLMVYEVREKQLRVLRVYHGARDMRY